MDYSTAFLTALLITAVLQAHFPDFGPLRAAMLIPLAQKTVDKSVLPEYI